MQQLLAFDEQLLEVLPQKPPGVHTAPVLLDAHDLLRVPLVVLRRETVIANRLLEVAENLDRSFWQEVYLFLALQPLLSSLL